VTIWADADSLQAEIRRLICRRANAESKSASGEGRQPRFRAVFIAARMPPLDLGPGVEAETVAASASGEGDKPYARASAKPREGAADDRIAERARPGDLAVTRDLPLAERLADMGLRVLNDRGGVFTSENARERRSLRDSAVELRALGLMPESPRRSNWSARQLKAFADALDREIAKLH
jgi:uncharacterized protein YaiI (UPF0178 family)